MASKTGFSDHSESLKRLSPLSGLTTGSTVVMVTHDVDEAVLLSDRVVMMTNGPAATIGEVLSVPITPVREAPRNRIAMAHHPEYLAARERVLEFLYRKQAHVEPLRA